MLWFHFLSKSWVVYAFSVYFAKLLSYNLNESWHIFTRSCLLCVFLIYGSEDKRKVIWCKLNEVFDESVNCLLVAN